MGTKGKCTKCGKEHYIDTGMLETIHRTQGIRPKDWIKTKYICRNCRNRIKLLKNSNPSIIEEKLEDFAKECNFRYRGLYYTGEITQRSLEKFKNDIRELMIENGITKYSLIVENKTITGMKIVIPVIGEVLIGFI